MKVALMTGSWPPVRCGVADYSERLAEALAGLGIDVARIDGHGSMTRAAEVVKAIADQKADVLHVQYPAVGYGRSLLPSLLPLVFRTMPVIVTLHEFSIFKFYRMPWFVPFAYAAGAIVLTSEAERSSFTRRLPRPRARLEVIGIGSNIPRGEAAARTPKSVCYFGLLMPAKGLEEFLDFARCLMDIAPDWTVRLIGTAAAGCEVYAASIVARARILGIELLLDQTAEAVADRLSATIFAYLPGPGGISERRGSVLAALENGVRVVGPLGENVPPWLRNRVIDARSPSEAARAVASSEGEPGDLAPGGETSWSHIAGRHRSLYDRLLRGAVR